MAHPSKTAPSTTGHILRRKRSSCINVLHTHNKEEGRQARYETAENACHQQYDPPECRDCLTGRFYNE